MSLKTLIEDKDRYEKAFMYSKGKETETGEGRSGGGDDDESVYDTILTVG